MKKRKQIKKNKALLACSLSPLSLFPAHSFLNPLPTHLILLLPFPWLAFHSTFTSYNSILPHLNFFYNTCSDRELQQTLTKFASNVTTFSFAEVLRFFYNPCSDRDLNPGRRLTSVRLLLFPKANHFERPASLTELEDRSAG